VPLKQKIFFFFFFLFPGKVWNIRASFGGKKKVFLRGGGSGLIVFRLVGGHSKGGTEVARD
jgi:hypothetical protein